MKRILAFSILTLLLAGCAAPMIPDSTASTPSTQITQATGITTAPTGSIQAVTGWLTEDGNTVYIHPDGTRHTGWLDLDGTRYYLDENGILQTGWFSENGLKYYLQSDGSIARGKTNIDGVNFYFSSAGVYIILVNPQHFIPYGYTPDLVSAEDGYVVDSSCRDALLQMLADCRTAGYDARITSAYRQQETQIELYNNKVYYFLNQGYDEAAARKEAATIIAVPGTSEHQLGLAVDLVDSSYWVLDEAQEKTPAQRWLMEHCWEYGFILRYPNGKTESTGIVYEPWHYRYVGKDLAMELKDSGLCLEEYFDSLN